MKKFFITLAILLTSLVSADAMSYEQARDQALFLTDKMAYELNLNEQQYEAAYEINLDYLMGVTTVDDVYSACWRQRNLDMQYIMLDWQYSAFCAATYFFRPLYWNAGAWHFGIYAHYPHRDYFYYSRPVCYVSYRGGHSWRLNGGASWYVSRTVVYRGRGDMHHGMREVHAIGVDRSYRAGGIRGGGSGYRSTEHRGVADRRGSYERRDYSGNRGTEHRGTDYRSGSNYSNSNSGVNTHRGADTNSSVRRGNSFSNSRSSSTRTTVDRQTTTTTAAPSRGNSFSGRSSYSSGSNVSRGSGFSYSSGSNVSRGSGFSHSSGSSVSRGSGFSHSSGSSVSRGSGFSHSSGSSVSRGGGSSHSGGTGVSRGGGFSGGGHGGR